MNMEPRGFVPSSHGDIAPPDPTLSEKEDKGVEAYRPSSGETAQPTQSNIVEEFFGAGTVLGELGVLERNSRIMSIECETPVRVSEGEGELVLVWWM